jgi:hypothetical protein
MSILATIVIAACSLIALVILVAGLPIRARRTREEVIAFIEAFINGTGGPNDWDEFTCVRIKDPTLDLARRRCLAIDEQFPPSEPGPYCDEVGLIELRRIVKELSHPESKIQQ